MRRDTVIIVSGIALVLAIYAFAAIYALLTLPATVVWQRLWS